MTMLTVDSPIVILISPALSFVGGERPGRLGFNGRQF